MVNEIHMNINKSNPLLLHPLNKWMKKKKWSWFPHQIETFYHVRTGSDVVVFAPTGAGKTLSGFINPIDDLIKLKKFKGLHTLYISPLKSLANDIVRNLEKPIKELDLNISFQVRTGDTTPYKKQKQKQKPPNILITTPESLALLNSFENEAEYMFKNLWLINKKKLKIAVHHGSLEKNLRLKVENNLSKGLVDCVVATSSLELGLDYGDVEKIIQVGAPK